MAIELFFDAKQPFLLKICLKTQLYCIYTEGRIFILFNLFEILFNKNLVVCLRFITFGSTKRGNK